MLQTFEPIGIGARNLREYLLIQIDFDLNAKYLAKKFVQYRLENVANLSIKCLSNYYKISTKDTHQIIRYIQGLNPFPNVQHSNITEGYVIPEITVEKLNDEWVIHINHPLRPTIEINQEYVAMLKSNEQDEIYCRQCLKDITFIAKWH